MRQFLDRIRFSFRNKFSQLYSIADGLRVIHKKGLLHRDFHSGNILNGGSFGCCYIADLGLCRPADETSQEKIFGVMPYMAPEVLLGKTYIQASDVYSFGIVAYELLSGLPPPPPYYDVAHDEFLGLKICQGLRPNLNNVQAPQLLKDLIKKCWDANPEKRPTAQEIEKILETWFGEIDYYLAKSDFYQQSQKIKEAEETENQESLNESSCQIHSRAVYHSRLLPTKEITNLLSEQFSRSLQIDFSESSQVSTEQTAQTLQPTNQPYGTPGTNK